MHINSSIEDGFIRRDAVFLCSRRKVIDRAVDVYIAVDLLSLPQSWIDAWSRERSEKSNERKGEAAKEWLLVVCGSEGRQRIKLT